MRRASTIVITSLPSMLRNSPRVLIGGVDGAGDAVLIGVIGDVGEGVGVGGAEVTTRRSRRKRFKGRERRLVMLLGRH